MPMVLSKNRGSKSGARMAASPRKRLRKGPKTAFALHLRALLDAKGWQVHQLHEAIGKQGVDVDKPAIQKWLRGETWPKPSDLVAIGQALGLPDPRHILPPPG